MAFIITGLVPGKGLAIIFCGGKCAAVRALASWPTYALFETPVTPQNTNPTQWAQNRYGQQILIDPNDFIGRKLLRNGVYDHETLDFLESLFGVMKPRVILDVGANIGNHTLMFSRYATQVLAFEPGQKAFGMLQQNVQANGLGHVTALNYGLSESNSQQTLYVETSSNLGESSLTLANLTSSDYVEDLIQLRVGDEAVVEQQVDAVDFIKIDVEGHEQSVIRGLRASIARCRPVILMEWEMEKGWLLGEVKQPDVLVDYEFFPLIWNTSWEYWKGKRLGWARRLWVRAFGHKQRVPCPLAVSANFGRVSDVLLVPREKLGLVERFVYR